MFKTMDECTDFIFKLRASMYKGEPLEASRIILKALGNPEAKRKYIHFAGSNGKGSTLNATREILMAHGLTVGAFISPHLERPNERVTINKQEISDEQFLLYANRIAEVVNEQLKGQFPSFFELMTIIAFQHFAYEQVDVVVLETGIGGRLDSTNVITPEVCVITTITLEHTVMLGDTYAKVAFEKAGIIKERKPVVIGVKNREALDVITEQARLKNATPFILGETMSIEPNGVKSFNYHGVQSFEMLALTMSGQHQMENAALAITTAQLYLGELSEVLVREALVTAKWAGRFEQFGESIILDGAHNSEGTAALLATLQRLYPNKRYRFIYAAMADKDHAVSIGMMDALATHITFTQLPIPTAMPAHQLAHISTHSACRYDENWQNAVKEEIATAADGELVIITGSLYFIGEVRNFLARQGGERDDSFISTL